MVVEYNDRATMTMTQRCPPSRWLSTDSANAELRAYNDEVKSAAGRRGDGPDEGGTERAREAHGELRESVRRAERARARRVVAHEDHV